LKEWFGKYLRGEYENGQTERLYYYDIGKISKFIIERFKNGQIEYFSIFFDAVESILNNCDTEVENLIVVGMFEDIQNIGGSDINYYTSFNQWLKPLSKSKWDKLIDFWEGDDWRNDGKSSK